jgi:UDP-glucuronate 4-epimerase
MGVQVTCLDNFDDFYPTAIKRANVRHLLTLTGNSKLLQCCQGDIREQPLLHRLFQEDPVDVVIHLAARAGVLPSLEQPLLYSEVNIQGTLNLLECCRQYGVHYFVFASSSSVYGARQQGPFCETDDVNMPVSPYAATKRAGELLCATYAHLYQMRIACLRFFTVYGPRQRPDLAIHKFARLMSSGQPITVYGDGSSQRDYTYIDDIIDGILQAWAWLQHGDTSAGVYEIFNLGGAKPVQLIELIRALEISLGCRAVIHWLPMQPGDVPLTFADLRKSRTVLGYWPHIDLPRGIARFAAWFQQMNSENT